jgi:hypothetical protein
LSFAMSSPPAAAAASAVRREVADHARPREPGDLVRIEAGHIAQDLAVVLAESGLARISHQLRLNVRVGA